MRELRAHLDPHELVNPRSRLSGTPPVLRSTKHLFFRLSSVQDELAEWISTKDQWRVQVRKWSEAFVRGGLLDRPITRDLTWGVPVPAEWGLGEDKRIYVWFEAVMGYLSATIEYCARKGVEWQDWWASGDEEVESVYFVGKDNIPFHTVIWPGMLRAHGGLRLPTNVPANQYVILGGRKASKSAGVGRTAADYLSWMSADALRYALASELPEANDTELDDKQLVRRINDELASGWGNLVNRLLVMSKKYINGGHIPELDFPESSELLHVVDQILA